jgi:hypothetical protein
MWGEREGILGIGRLGNWEIGKLGEGGRLGDWDSRWGDEDWGIRKAGMQEGWKKSWDWGRVYD